MARCPHLEHSVWSGSERSLGNGRVWWVRAPREIVEELMRPGEVRKWRTETWNDQNAVSLSSAEILSTTTGTEESYSVSGTVTEVFF